MKSRPKNSLTFTFASALVSAFLSLPASSHGANATASDENAPEWLKVLYRRLDRDNNELNVAKLGTSYSYQDTRAARSELYPSLSLSSAASKGKQGTLPSPGNTSITDSSLSGGQGSSVGINGGSVASSLPTNTDGVVHQVSASYILFSHFAISENIRRSDLSLEKSRLGERADRAKKRAQLLQLLAEWQWLNRIKAPLGRAGKTIESVNEAAARPTARSLFSDVERVDLSERRASIDYFGVKVDEGKALVELALLDLIPDLTPEELAGLPEFQLRYEPPPENRILGLYREKSLAERRDRLDIESAQSAARVASWQRPWVPTVALSASASQSRQFEGGAPIDSWSTGLILNFSLFDGFSRDARRQQTGIALEMAERKRRFTENKTLLFLRHQRMKAAVAAAEYRKREVVVERKKLLSQDVQRKRKLGVATALEESAAELDLTKAQLEALEPQKDRQAAMLDIAVELDELDKVVIDSKKGGDR